MRTSRSVSEHATTRLGERGITPRAALLACALGSLRMSGSGRRIHVMDRRAMAAAGAQGVPREDLAAARGVAVVVAADGTVVTTWRDWRVTQPPPQLLRRRSRRLAAAVCRSLVFQSSEEAA